MISMISLNCKTTFLSFYNNIIFIQSEYRKYVIKETNKFNFYVKFWNHVVLNLYEKLKRSKNKKLLANAKMILNIKEKDRNDCIKADLLLQKRIYASKYLFYKNYLDNIVM